MSTLLRALGMINGTRLYKKNITRRLNLAFCVLCFVSFSLAAGAEPAEYAPGVVIVKFYSDNEAGIYDFVHRAGAYSSEQAFAKIRGAQSPQRLSAIYKLNFSPDADVASMARKFQEDPLVEYAQPNYIERPCSETSGGLNDLFYEDQWALRAIDALEAWEMEKGSSDVVIAIVDSGVDYNHEDLEPRIWINPGEIDGNGLDDDGNGYVDDIRGWDFVDSPYLPADVDQLDRDNDPMDENGHGTHVAGIAAAVPNNSKGIAGITWNCRIMALRGGGDFFEDDDLSAAIVYAADNGADIINMSWGGEELSYIIRDALEYAYERGCVLIAAAGNEDRPIVIYPAIHKYVIAVGATDRFDRKAYFSNYGLGLDIAAPGHKVFGTTRGGKYSDWSGTSMATPVVSGVVALMLSRRPGLTNDEVFQILRFSADEVDDPLLEGIGRINAAKALAAVISPLMAGITYPDSRTGADTILTIKGTAAGPRFLRFQLEYGAVPDVDSFTSSSDINWIPIGHSRNTPMFDNLLETWNVSHLDEGTYVLRLRVFGSGNLEAEDRVVLVIDHSSPEITELRIAPRYEGENYRYVVKWRTDDTTFGEVYYRENGSKVDFKRLTSLSTADKHAIYTEFGPGSYECFVAATNEAGLTTIDDNNGDYYPLEIKMLKVTPYGLTKTAVDLPTIHPMNGRADFDGDGRTEIVGMNVKWLYDTVRIYERNESGGYDEAFSSDEVYFPWAVADTDRDGLFEILGNKRGITFLYESPSPGSYPTEKIWEVEGAWGGKVADLDLDGRREVVARYLDGDEIRIYENRGDNSYLKVARLQNPTEGSNYLSTTFATADFDGDGKIEIAMGDWSGDLLVYENIGDDRYLHTWTGSIPHSHVKYVEAGDFDGDGIDEFIVGASAEELYTSIERRWVYTLFDCQNQNQYEAVWSREFLGEKHPTAGISAGDVDRDGRDEIFIIITPSLYIFKVLDTSTASAGEWEVEPVWYHSADDTKWPIMEDLDADNVNEILFNDGDKLTVFEWNEVESVPTRRPWGLSAKPLGETEVELHWNGPPEAQTYRIYRGTDVENLRQVNSTVTREYFRDSGLENGMTYWYSVASVNAAGQESEVSDKVSATPNSPPELISAEYVSPFVISLTFNEPMGPSAQNEAGYMVTSETGIKRSASSAILKSQGMEVLLTLERASSDGGLPRGSYTVTVSDIQDASGVAISANGNSTTFHVPGPDAHTWSDLSHVVVYPNPVMPSSRHPGKITFGNLPPDTTIRIYDCNGQLVKSLGAGESMGGRIIWYLDNDEHREIASGTYVYVAEWKQNIRIGKLAVVR